MNVSATATPYAKVGATRRHGQASQHSRIVTFTSRNDSLVDGNMSGNYMNKKAVAAAAVGCARPDGRRIAANPGPLMAARKLHSSCASAENSTQRRRMTGADARR